MPEWAQDLDLARCALAGDEDSWRRIVLLTAPVLRTYLHTSTGDREEARDLLQETYLRVLRRLHQYRGEGPLQAWIRRIAERQVLDFRRRLRASREGLRRWRDSQPQAPRDLDPAEERRALAAALRKLPPRHRTILLLRGWHGMSYREIARLLRCREGTARVLQSRTCRRMRRLLA